jgi:Zn-dependent M28 family amino/carboxypeptidase
MAIAFQALPIQARNVLGLLPGVDPQRKDELVVIGAHYDHMGRDPNGTIYNGANDNASGVAVMLEIARLWQMQGFRPAHSVLFAAWDDEEQGLVGSQYYVSQPIYPLDHTVAMLNLDMAGVGDELHISGEGVVIMQLRASAKIYNFPAILDEEGGSDEASFQMAGIPAGLCIIYSGSKLDLAYHRPEDDTSHIQLASLRTIGILAAHALAAWSGGPVLE